MSKHYDRDEAAEILHSLCRSYGAFEVLVMLKNTVEVSASVDFHNNPNAVIHKDLVTLEVAVADGINNHVLRGKSAVAIADHVLAMVSSPSAKTVNKQRVLIVTDDASKITEAMRERMTLVVPDYSSLEARVMEHVAGDEAVIPYRHPQLDQIPKPTQKVAKPKKRVRADWKKNPYRG